MQILSLLVASAAFQGVEPIDVPSPVAVYSTWSGSPTSLVPGGGPSERFVDFTAVRQTKAGGAWTLSGVTDAASGQDQVILIDGVVELRSGIDPMPGGAPGELFGGGQLEISGDGRQLLIGGPQSSPSFDSRFVARGQGGSWQEIHRAGDPAPQVSGATFTSFDRPELFGTTSYGFTAEFNLGGTSFEAGYLDDDPVYRAGFTVPGGQAGSLSFEGFAPNHWAFNVCEFTGAYGIAGTLDGGIDFGAHGLNVRFEGGQLALGYALNAEVDDVPFMMATGAVSWLAGGRTQIGQDFVADPNGLVADDFESVGPGSALTWQSNSIPDVAFLYADAQLDGDAIIAGKVPLGPALVQVGLGEHLVFGDALDLNGNGLPDDPLFFRDFVAFSDYAEDGSLYAIVEMMTNSNTPFGKAVLKFDFSEFDVGLGTRYCDSPPNSTGSRAVLSATGSRVATDNDVTMSVVDLPPNQFGILVNGTDSAFVQNPGGSAGHLCLGGTLGRYNAQIANTGAAGAVSISLDLGATPSGAGFTSVAAGDDWFFQFWYRDTPATSNFSSAMTIQFN